MILLDVKAYIKQHQWVNLQDLSLHFQRDLDTMRDILGHWVRKGVICRAPKPAGCGVACGACKPMVAEVYCWRDVTFLTPLTTCH